MYLPDVIPNAKVLVTVKTYPNPSVKYDELVCNAGFLETGEWVRVYPVKFRSLPYDQQYRKYDWIDVNLVRKHRDLRQESYAPQQGIEETIGKGSHIGTGKDRLWTARKRFALREVFTSMQELIRLSKTPNVFKSLATVKPSEIVGFEIKEDDREWKPKFREGLRQMSLFASSKSESKRELDVVKKLPYKYYYRFLSEGDSRPRRMMIEDWEIGQLYWNCLAKTEGDEFEANQLVKKKYAEELLKKDIYFFVGTTLANHVRAPNPFVIIGLFYPPYSPQQTFDF